MSQSGLNQTDKSVLRRQLLQKRRALPAHVRRHAEQAVCRHYRQAGWLLRFHRIGVFMASGSEISTLPLLDMLLAAGKQVFFPLIPHEPRLRKLWFTRLHADARWVENRHGIAELAHAHAVRARDLDLLLMPLAGFDAAGNRLGMGGGYYDASLAYLRHRHHWRTPTTVGLAFGCQELSVPLPVDPWDVPLSALLTESGVRIFRKR